MHRFCLSLLLISCNCLLTAGPFNSASDLETFISDSEIFYIEYLSEQKDIDATVNLGTATVPLPLTPPPLTPPPPNPPAPPSLDGFLPFVIVNSSGLPDDEVFITVIGTQVGSSPQPQLYLTFDSMGVGTATVLDSMSSGTVPSVPLSSITVPMSAHTYALYMPPISGGRIYFSMKTALSMPISGTAITEPSVLNQSLSSYSIAFDKYEFAYVPTGSPQIAADATAVDFFCLPLYGFLSTPNAGSPSNSGLHESQNYIMNTIIPFFFNNRSTNAAILAQWNNLYVHTPAPSNLIRVLSPQLAMSVDPASTFPNKFDPNYFDNAAAYGFSFINFLWSGASSYYKTTSQLFIQTPASGLYPSPITYQGTISGTNEIDFSPAFTTESQSFFSQPNTITPPTPSGPTSYVILSAQNLNTMFAANLQGNQVSKLFEEALVAGLLPTPFSNDSPLSNAYLQANSGNYYKNSANLPANAGGPWYSVYSEALHYIGPIYAFGFDEPLYPNVLMESDTLQDTTYIGITIGICDLVP